MAITYYDNPKRQIRLVELGTDAQEYLFEAQKDYEAFQSLLKEVNSKIADVYREANLQPPSVRKVDILKEAGVADLSVDDTIVEITEILADITGLVANVKYLAPAATSMLVRKGIITKEAATEAWKKFTIPLIGKEVEIIPGQIAGQIIGNILGGIAIAGFDIAIEAIEGAEAKKKLVDAIHKIYLMRTLVRISQKKAVTFVDALRSIKTSLDAIASAGLDINDKVIQNLIQKCADPSITKEKAITETTVLEELKSLDKGRDSYTSDDPTN